MEALTLKLVFVPHPTSWRCPACGSYWNCSLPAYYVFAEEFAVTDDPEHNGAVCDPCLAATNLPLFVARQAANAVQEAKEIATGAA